MNNRANFGQPHVLDHQMKGLMDDVFINGAKVTSWDIFSLGKNIWELCVSVSVRHMSHDWNPINVILKVFTQKHNI